MRPRYVWAINSLLAALGRRKRSGDTRSNGWVTKVSGREAGIASLVAVPSVPWVGVSRVAGNVYTLPPQRRRGWSCSGSRESATTRMGEHGGRAITDRHPQRRPEGISGSAAEVRGENDRAGGSTPSPPRIWVTVEEDGVWIYANRDGLKALADRIGVLGASISGALTSCIFGGTSARTGAGAIGRRGHRGRQGTQGALQERFEVTVMAVEPKDLRKVRGQKPGKLRRVEGGSGGMRPVAAAAWLILPFSSRRASSGFRRRGR